MGPAITTELATEDNLCARVVMLPFANIGRWYKDPLNRPPVESKGLSYAVWLPEANGPGWLNHVKMSHEERKSLAAIFDCVEIGNAESEAAHNVGGGVADVCDGRPCIRGVAPAAIVCTLSGCPSGPSTLIILCNDDAPVDDIDILINSKQVPSRVCAAVSKGLVRISCHIPGEWVCRGTDQYGQVVSTVEAQLVWRKEGADCCVFKVALVADESTVC